MNYNIVQMNDADRQRITDVIKKLNRKYKLQGDNFTLLEIVDESKVI